MIKSVLHALVLMVVVIAPRSAPTACASLDQEDWYRATLRIDDEHVIPFLLRLPDTFPGEGVIQNGQEIIRVSVDVSDRRCNGRLIDFPHFDSRITAEYAQGVGGYRGEWRKTRRDGVAVMPFEATLLDGPHPLATFSPDFGARYPLLDDGELRETRRYAMMFEEEGPAIGTFTFGRSVAGPEFHLREVTGAIQTTTGDYRFLAGMWQSGAGAGRNTNDLMLSVFDGAHAFLFTMIENADTSELSGGFYSGNWFHDTFTARRLADGDPYTLPDPFFEVALESSDGRLHVPALEAPRYHGKPTIVQIFGTWCPNCHEETPALVDLYRRYHDAGLEVLGLAYEITGNDARSRRQVERFIERYSVPWEIVIAGTSDKDQASATLPDLSRVKSFPTMIWIDRNGLVQAIHSGFSGSATGEEHTKLLAEFDRLTREIVASR